MRLVREFLDSRSAEMVWTKFELSIRKDRFMTNISEINFSKRVA